MRLPVQLTRRESIAAFSTLLVISMLIVAEWGVFPIIRYRKSLNQAIVARTVELEEIQTLQNTHVSLMQTSEGIRSRLARREKNFTLFSYLDRSAASAGVKEQIAYMKPFRSDSAKRAFKMFRVEMKLQSISLHRLSTFLYGVETADSLVRIKKASIAKSGPTAEGVDAVIWVETIAP
jgi:general secretion pathway protein M